MIGVMWGLLAFHMRFGVIMTGLGVISLAGIVVNNAIVLVDYVNQLRERGMSKRDALVSTTNKLAPAGAVMVVAEAGESQIVVRIDPRDVPKKGEHIWVTIRGGEQHVFSAATGARLSAPTVAAK